MKRSICSLICVAVSALGGITLLPALACSQDRLSHNSALTPLQREIAAQRARLNSEDPEERRNALVHLGNLRRAESSRVALVALNDSSALVRATAAHAVLSLPAPEVITALVPLLADKSEFVRQSAAYSLGMTRSRGAVEHLVARLMSDKDHGVRGAAAVALGHIRDESAVTPLVAILSRDLVIVKPGKNKKSDDKKDNEFVLRAAARALGEIRSRAGVPALIRALADEGNADDVRREAAQALGWIGDTAAEPALRAVLGASDPYLAKFAKEALVRIQRTGARPVM
ncbi:MAG: HEAT repeat domain-containing protein [Pyrinomonadaceae bacterium]